MCQWSLLFLLYCKRLWLILPLGVFNLWKLHRKQTFTILTAYIYWPVNATFSFPELRSPTLTKRIEALGTRMVMRMVMNEISNSYKFRRVGPARWWNDALQSSVFARLLARSSSEFRASDFKVFPLPPRWRRLTSHTLIIRHAYRPFPSSKSHFQNEVKCETFVVKMSFIYITIKNHFHISGFALSLALKVRFFGTRKWPVALEVAVPSHNFPVSRQ